MIDPAFHPLIRLDMGPLHYFSVLGRALFTAQHLEMNCRAIVAYLEVRGTVSHHGSSILEDPEFREGMERLWKKTLGAHVRILTRRFSETDDTSAVLKKAVEARNEIAHEVAMDVSNRLDQELGQRIARILRLVRQIAQADKIASGIIHTLNGDPLPSRGYFISYEDRVTAWVAEETFEN